MQTLPDSIDADTLRPFLTRAGGELVDRSDLDGPGAGPDPDRPPLVKVIAEDGGKLRLEID